MPHRVLPASFSTSAFLLFLRITAKWFTRIWTANLGRFSLAQVFVYFVAAGMLLASGCDQRSGESIDQIEDLSRGGLAEPTVTKEGSIGSGAVDRSLEMFFQEVPTSSGFDFQHIAGRTPDYRYFEIVGSGAALFDYDNDGDLDIYIVQDHQFEDFAKQESQENASDADATSAAVTSTQAGARQSDRLFRNDSPQGDPNAALKFTDVTGESGVSVSTGYGQGVTYGDVDNDGDLDVYVTNFGENVFLRNNGDGTFGDATVESGLRSDRWGAGATFIDYDRDGWLDLYVCNYVTYSASTDKPCFGASGRRDYCGPNSYDGEADQLFRNDGRGHFIDVSEQAGIAGVYGAGLGVTGADFDGDQWPDIYVANDGMENRLWINQKDGTFQDSALLFGCAYNAVGVAEAGMGVDAGDFDNDGDEDLIVAHLTGETNTLYENDGSGGFSDRTNLVGLAAPSLAMTSFGIRWVDFDNDSNLDLVVVNGTVKRENGTISTDHSFPLGQPNQVFQNTGKQFVDVSDHTDATFRKSEMSRGLVVGDLDNDGDSDFVVVNNDGPARLYRNQVGHQKPWIGLRLVGQDAKRDQVGAVAKLKSSSGQVIKRRVRNDGSYYCAHDSRVLFGVPSDWIVSELEVEWPDGNTERFDPPAIGRYTTIGQGSGR
ncbi:CRTAC1 family protein [Stieleria sp. JC731]|uniref:CRTAC1 family protein n=1 Tax=Pirellulaceae TaxID=2691357 RepID=UPI001E549506|nr:CRTAC1 family protein [Stieleria sp. JC731]MCC9599781.1 CRTAC1 family protein [Stieleria sp. JC731]